MMDDLFAQMRLLAKAGWVVIFALTLLIVAAGCNDDEDDEEPSETVTEQPTATAAASPTEEPFSGGTGPEEGDGSPAGTTAVLVDLRTGEHVDFDRITFEFRDARPGYLVEYVEPPIIADASGEEVEIDGEAFLRIRMDPSAGHDPNTGDETYTGGLELKPGLPALVEAERTGDFEGVLTWVLGLSEETEFRVYELEEPNRLVVDVAHP
jgi:hypothetical protein